MKTQLTEHSKKLKLKTANEWQSKKIKEGGFKFTVTITDPEIAKYAREIQNKTQFLINIIKKEIIEKKVEYISI